MKYNTNKKPDARKNIMQYMPVESLDDIRSTPVRDLSRNVRTIVSLGFGRRVKGAGDKRNSQGARPESAQIIEHLTRRVENLENINRCLLKQLAATNRHRAEKIRGWQERSAGGSI